MMLTFTFTQIVDGSSFIVVDQHFTDEDMPVGTSANALFPSFHVPNQELLDMDLYFDRLVQALPPRVPSKRRQWFLQVTQ